MGDVVSTRRLGRRRLIAGTGSLLAAPLIGRVAAMAQESSPVADPTPSADPVAGETQTGSGATAFTLYSGRNETLVGPLLEQYAAEADVSVETRFGSTGEMAATIQEEGDNTPAAAFLAQDAGALGLLAQDGRFQRLPDDLLDRVESRFRDPEGRWVGVTGRARVLAYNTGALAEADLPASVHELTDPKWEGRIGWAPENASFQAFVTAFRMLEGDDAARTWLEAMIANGTVNFADSNTAIVRAIGAGEIDAGLTNNYYAYVVRKEEGADFPVANHFFAAGDPGSLINVSGIGVIEGAADAAAALAFVDFLLSTEAQEYFATETFEYPLIAGVQPAEGLPALDKIGHPDIDLSSLADLRGTLELLAEVGLI
jgi:iron(III) transport system substrate-binding protein